MSWTDLLFIMDSPLINLKNLFIPLYFAALVHYNMSMLLLCSGAKVTER